MKILHIGLCVQPKPFNGFQQAFIDIIGEDNYREISTSDPYINVNTKIEFDLFKPDIVFMQIQSPGIISNTICQYMKEQGSFIINWTGDKRNEVPQWMIDLAPNISLTSFSNMDDVNYMRSLGFKSDYLEIGYDPNIYNPIGEAYHMPNIVFMGNNYGIGYFPMSEYRINMVDFLQKEYGNMFGVYGNGWNHCNGNFNGSQYEEAKAYRGAKIAINCSHFDSLNYNSDRLLRILGTGVKCVSYNHKGMKETYGNNVSYFNDFNELRNEIDKILINSNNEKNNTFVKNTFTFEHQVKNIIKLAV